MRNIYVVGAVVIAVGVGGWFLFQELKPPMLATPVPQAEAPKPSELRRRLPPPSPTSYQGRTPEQWSQVLAEGNRDDTVHACRALWVLGAQGRPYLLQGL